MILFNYNRRSNAKKLLKIIKSDTTISAIISIGVLIVLVAITTFLWMDYQINFSSAINSEKAGQFGDFVGGIAGSLWALAGVFLFYKALTEQREDFKNNKKTLDLQVDALNQQITEFKLSRGELISSRKVYEEQSKTLRTQQFESNFYSLLNVFINIKSKLNADADDYFKELSLVLEKKYDKENNVVEQHNEMIGRYINLYNKNREKLTHYYRSFYRVVKIIDANVYLNKEEKMFYSKILRSQITDYELIFLYYNSHTMYGEKTQRYILEYNLLKHMPIFSKPEFKGFYNIQGDEIIAFTKVFEQFLAKHIDQYYDVDCEYDKFEEEFDSFKVIVGVYFNDASLVLKVICDPEIKRNGIVLTDKDFESFLLHFIYDRVVFSNYQDPHKVILRKSKTETESQKEFCISIDADASLNVNIDKY